MSNKIQVSCDECGKRLAVPSTAAGKKIRCPGCEAVIRVLNGESRPPRKKKTSRRPKQHVDRSGDNFGDDPYAASSSSGLPPRAKKKRGSKSKRKPSPGGFSGAKKLQLGASIFFGSMLFSASRIAVFGNKTPVTAEEKGAAFGAALVIFVGVVAGLILMLWGMIQKRKKNRD